jgi:hypothetical protein
MDPRAINFYALYEHRVTALQDGVEIFIGEGGGFYNGPRFLDRWIR